MTIIVTKPDNTGNARNFLFSIRIFRLVLTSSMLLPILSNKDRCGVGSARKVLNKPGGRDIPSIPATHRHEEPANGWDINIPGR
jgi:hypothetical protein